MAKKYYAVKHGKTTGIFTSWEECKATVDGVANAKYKGFSTLEDAQAYLNDEAPKPVEVKEGCAVAYVDGSYKADTEEFSYGAILFLNGEEIEFSGADYNPDVKDMRNVAGELKGAMVMMNYCIKNNIPALEIHHDYEGIAKWARGEWKTNKPGTKMYKEYYDRISDKLDVTFVKVKGHSGDTNNDRADKLAKKALGIE